MAKVYLLLRSNKQTGPHTIDELIQMGLKASDLIWIEGKSFGWSHPTEIDSLKEFVSDTDKVFEKKSTVLSETQKKNVAAEETFGLGRSGNLVSDLRNKKVHVSLPGNASRHRSQELSANDLLEKKAEELRKRAQAFTPGQTLSTDSVIETKFNRSINEVEQDYTDWVFKQKASSKKSFSKQKLTFVLIGFVIVGLIYFTITFLGEKSTQKNAVVAATRPASSEVQPRKTDTTVSQPVIQAQASTIEEPPGNTVTEPKPSKSIPAPTRKQKQPTTTIASMPTGQKKIDNTMEAPILEDRIPVDEEVAVQTTKEKKSLGQKVSGFFGKLKNKKDVNEDEPVSLPNSEGSRNAERREESVKKEEISIDLANFAELSSNIRSSSWMMGVRGLKITLRNKGSQTIQSASAEVKYYNEQNELLEKKVVQFTNVPAKKSLAVAAPDHRLADHVEFQLLSATGIEN